MAWIPLVVSAAASVYNGIKSSKDKKSAQNQIDQERARILGQQNYLQNYFERGYTDSLGRNDKSYNDIYNGYNSLLGAAPTNTSLGPGGSGRTGNVESLIDSYKNYANNPMSGSDKFRMRGNGVYDEFAQTGGWSNADKQNYLKQATSAIPSFYGNVNNELRRRATVTGNSAALSGSLARSLREQAHAASDAQTNAELGLQGQINQGRQWGASGVSSSEQALQNILQNAKLGGLAGAGNLEMGLMSAEDKRALDQANLNLQGSDQDLRAKLAALTGMQNLRTQTPGDTAMYAQLLAQLFGSTNSSIGQLLNPQMNQATNGGFFSGFNQAGNASGPLANALSTYFQTKNTGISGNGQQSGSPYYSW